MGGGVDADAAAAGVVAGVDDSGAGAATQMG